MFQIAQFSFSSFMTQFCLTNVLSSDKRYKLDVFCWLLHHQSNASTCMINLCNADVFYDPVESCSIVVRDGT